MSGDKQIVVGLFYEQPGGKIAYIYMQSKRSETTVFVYYEDGGNPKTAPLDEVLLWKERPDLKDFPNAIDPKLPYEFDLHWDIKYMSDLKRELVGHQCEKQIRQTMVKHGIVLKGKKYKEIIPDSKCYLLTLAPGEEPCVVHGPFKVAKAWNETVKFFKETGNKVDGRLLLLEVFEEGTPCVTEYTKEDCDKLRDAANGADVGI